MHNVQIKLILLVVFEVFGNNISKKISKLQNFVAFEIETLKRIRSSNSGLLLLKCGIFPVKWFFIFESDFLAHNTKNNVWVNFNWLYWK